MTTVITRLQTAFETTDEGAGLTVRYIPSKAHVRALFTLGQTTIIFLPQHSAPISM